MPLLDGDPLREEQRLRSLVPPTPGPSVSASEAIQLPPSYLMHVAEHAVRRRARERSEFLNDGPASVIDLHRYEDMIGFNALLQELGRDFTGSAAVAEPEVSSVPRSSPLARERNRQWVEAARALAAYNGVSIG